MVNVVSLVVLSALLVQFFLTRWLVPANEKKLKDTKGRYYSYGSMAFFILIILVLVFGTELPVTENLPAFALPVFTLAFLSQAFAEWYFAPAAKEYVVTAGVYVYVSAPLVFLLVL
ncbi:DUF4181 domain-containing protein [Salipaludibacillus sp. CUR1]|uniref:DUF4181 domain-containing protein n=1 Tax=Salipaludibacillus sp. CUR1 TaxID=2820003 RepID=UPI001E587885|nr:DUF4181 domain-containing protein [Salipaludibacillus sp. CUR1]MCE7794421.1 DUF4181 domain-containing protein [Salipaludibacillus sp. CUR1]